jgi:hypothetical protein
LLGRPINTATALPGVTYHPMPYLVPRLYRTRFNPLSGPLGAGRGRKLASELAGRLSDFGADAIVAVAYRYLWFAAAEAARQLGIPFHLILYDDWSCTETGNAPGSMAGLRRRVCRWAMTKVYRDAATRLCISPGMVDQYRRCFKAGGTVLYPSRGDDSPIPRVRVGQTALPPVVAYCGKIHQPGTADLLRRLGDVLAGLGGRVDLYTPYSREELAYWKLDRPHVRRVGFVSPPELAASLGASAHALFLPGSFDPCERDDVTTLFPSKLADYTAIGLPILIWAPRYSSAGRWGAENPGAAVTITDPEPAAVRHAVERLASDPEYAASLARAGIEAGRRYFDLAVARQTFFRAIAQIGLQ